MYVQVIPKPYPNEINIGGNAVALNCTHDNRMMIKIVDQPVVIDGGASYNSYRQKINEVAGCWLEVETDYLFKDQFNTAAPHHLRIMMRNVAEIKNDVRVNRKFCRYCHHHTHIKDKICRNCNHDDYFEDFFPQVKHGKV
jgi:hypothetical protein